MNYYDVTAESTAAPSAMWALLLNASTWPAWSAVDALDTGRSEHLDAGGRDGVGALRAFRTGKAITSERITSLAPERTFSYEGVHNSYLRDYKASIDLQPLPQGKTRIHWHGTYRARWGLGWFMQRYLQRFMQKMADSLAAFAEQQRP